MTQNDLKGFRFRESTRAPFETEVKLRFDRFGGAVSGFSADISMEGMFVRTGEPKPVGTLVQFEFSLGQDGELIQGLGDVVWVRTRQLAPDKPPGMGIQFRYIDPHSRELIVRIVDKHLREVKEEGGGRDAEGQEQQGAPVSSPPRQQAPPPATAAPSATSPASPPIERETPLPTEPTPGPSPPPHPRTTPQEVERPPEGSVGLAGDTPSPAGSGSPAAPAEPSPTTGRSTGGGGELFIPDEAWDPVEAAARAVPETSFPVAEPAPRPAYSGSAGVARQSSGRRWAPLAVVGIVVALAGTGFVFRDRLRALLPGGAEEATAASVEPSSERYAEPLSEPSPRTGEIDELPVAANGSRPHESDASTPPPADGEVRATPEPARPEPAEPSEARLRRVAEIRSWQPAGETVVTIEGDGVLRDGDFSQLRLEDPPRLLIKLFGVEEAYRPTISIGSAELRQIRTALHSGSELHVVLDLASPGVQAEVSNESGRLRVRLRR